ncbi:MAG: alpha/beta fold hydrolase [Gemmatimonadales bacterium]
MTQPLLSAIEMTVQASDGLVLKGALVYPEIEPEGDFPLAVLAHQYPATADSFAPLVEDLLELGVAVLAFDERGHGASVQTADGRPLVIDTPLGFGMEAFGAAFVSSVAKVGFNRIDDDVLRVASWGVAQNFIDPAHVALIGASVGGTAVTLAAPRIPGLKALVTLGAAGELVWGDQGRARGRAAMEQIAASTLHASSKADPFGAADNARAWSDGLTYASTRIVPGAAHAMAIYYTVRADVIRLLEQALV